MKLNMDATSREFKVIRTGSRVKEFLKSNCRFAIRTLSRGLPDGILFHGSILLRKFGLRLKRASAPTVLQRVADFLFYSLRYMRPGLVEARLRGEKFFVQLNDPCQFDLLLGLHEAEVERWILPELREGMTFLDIGANIGYYTLLGARCVGTSGKVLALEPDPEVNAILRQNLEANSIDNVQVVHGAASRTCGHVRFGRAISSSYSSGLYCENAVNWIEVPGYSLDALVAESRIGVVNLVKLDVEGAEVEALEGMTQILSVDRPKVMMELHGRLDRDAVHPAVQKLKNMGYTTYHISWNHVVGEPSPARNERIDPRNSYVESF
jgi:FkbM family methyltransferase